MPVARYFLFVGGVLLALLFVVNAIVPQETVVAGTGASISSPAFDKSTVRIRSIQKLPERVVYDTSLPTLAPPQVNAVADAAPAATTDSSARARVRDTFAQFVPSDTRNDAATDEKSHQAVAPGAPAAQQAQATPAPKKRRIARAHTNPPIQLQQQRYAQPGMFQSYRVAQQQPRFGLFSGFGTW